MKTEAKDLPLETMDLQMGPAHPATHGTIKFNLKLEGEKILNCDVEVGFLHRGFDKSCEQATWTQVIPYTDRLNYASSLINNVGYALAVEKLIGAETFRYIEPLTLVGGLFLLLSLLSAAVIRWAEARLRLEV